MRRRSFALLQICAWSLYGLVHFAAALPAVPEREYWHLAGWKIIRATTGLFVSSALPAVYRRLPGGFERLAVVVVKVLAVSYLAGLLWSIIDRWALVTVVATTPLEVDWSRFPRGFELDYVFVMLAWSASYAALRYWSLAEEHRRATVEQQMLAREAQLQALAFQLNPHFLFNALNSIRALVAEDADRARLMITRLAAFLRHGLRAGETTTVAEELDAARAWFEIEKARFQDRLETLVESGPGAEPCIVPTRLLQPIVENAFKHGTPTADGPLRVTVRAVLSNDCLRIEVANSGRLAEPGDPLNAAGLGIANVRSRLQHAFGSRQQLRLEQRDGWVVATIEIEEPSP